jgi:DNA-directed RNA polymerase specialized sigma24 family protein
MQDQEVVAAIVAGDPEGIAEAYDRYAAPLYAYCSFILPGPGDAAAAVRDTFLIATVRLEGLRDPGKLRSWLLAVARSECLRRRSAAGIRSPLPKLPRPASGDDGPSAVELPAAELPAAELPAGLRRQVLTACADSTPAGRAERASTAHRAGAFGPAGFPKAADSPAPPWRRQLRRHPRAAAAAAVLAAVGVTAGIIVMLPVDGAHRAQASTFANAGQGAGGTPGAAGASPSPGRPAAPTKGQPTPSVTMQESTVNPGAGTPQAPAPASGPSSGSAAPTVSPSPSASPTPTPTPTPTLTPGILEAVPDELVLTSTAGKAVSGDFILSAVSGPVGHYAITVPAAVSGKIAVSPAQGSLPDGGWVTVTVTVTSKTALKSTITVSPGGLKVTVVLDIKKA